MLMAQKLQEEKEQSRPFKGNDMRIQPHLTPAPSQPPQTPHEPGRQQRPRVIDTFPWRYQHRTSLVVASLRIGIFDGVEAAAVERGSFEERAEVVREVSEAGGLAGHGREHVGYYGVGGEDRDIEGDGGGEEVCGGGVSAVVERGGFEGNEVGPLPPVVMVGGIEPIAGRLGEGDIS